MNLITLAKNKQSIFISLNITVRNLCRKLKRGQIEYKIIVYLIERQLLCLLYLMIFSTQKRMKQKKPKLFIQTPRVLSLRELFSKNWWSLVVIKLKIQKCTYKKYQNVLFVNGKMINISKVQSKVIYSRNCLDQENTLLIYNFFI